MCINFLYNEYKFREFYWNVLVEIIKFLVFVFYSFVKIVLLLFKVYILKDSLMY